jgi:MFS family permease
MIGAQVSTRLYPRFGPRRVVISGLLGIVAASSLMTQVQHGTSLWVMRILMLCLGYSVAHVMAPIQAAAFATISPAATGRASGFFNAARQLGGAVGVAWLTTIMIAVGVEVTAGSHGSIDLAPYHVAFACSAGLALLNAAFSTTIKDADAASTMRAVPEVAQTEPATASTAPAH